MTADPGSNPKATAVRGHAISFRGDPFLSDDAFVDIEDALIVSRDGVITAVGPYADLHGALPDDVKVTTYRDKLLCAGFVDAHLHYVQMPIIGAFGEKLLDWLNRYAFVEEQRFSSREHAEAVAEPFFEQLLANGTTTAVTFCATYPHSVDAFFEQATRRGMRMVGGKVLMDRNAPAGLLDTASSGYAESKRLIEKWHGKGRNMYAITPRFAPTSTPEQLELAGALWAESPGTFVHTHVSETVNELEWVQSLYPDSAGYLDVYEHYGLLGRRSILAHGVHLTERERQRLHETEAAIVHCPTSNLFLGSGLFDMRAAKQSQRPVHVALGTDVGAGTSFSLLATMNEAYKVAELNAFPLSALRLFYLATLGGAHALDLADMIGSIDAGKEADLIVLDPYATPLLAYRSACAESTEELMFVLAVVGDDRAVAATYIAGQLAYERPPSPASTT